MDLDLQTFWAFYNASCEAKQPKRQGQNRGHTMTSTQHDTRDKKLRDLRTIRDYLRDRRDALLADRFRIDAKVIGDEVSRLNRLISEAEAGQ